MELEEAHFDNCYMYVPSLRILTKSQRISILNDGLFQVSTVLERAIANVGGFDLVSEDTHDLLKTVLNSSGSVVKIIKDDVKYCSTRLAHNKKYNLATITNIANKIGNLRVQLYERFSNKFYYFIIPNHEFCNIKTIEIPFDLNYNPKRKNKWWKYEVESFEAMSKGE
jgi:hypothetical protein